MYTDSLIRNKVIYIFFLSFGKQSSLHLGLPLLNDGYPQNHSSEHKSPWIICMPRYEWVGFPKWGTNISAWGGAQATRLPGSCLGFRTQGGHWWGRRRVTENLFLCFMGQISIICFRITFRKLYPVNGGFLRCLHLVFEFGYVQSVHDMGRGGTRGQQPPKNHPAKFYAEKSSGG